MLLKLFAFLQKVLMMPPCHVQFDKSDSLVSGLQGRWITTGKICIGGSSFIFEFRCIAKSCKNKQSPYRARKETVEERVLRYI